MITTDGKIGIVGDTFAPPDEGSFLILRRGSVAGDRLSLDFRQVGATAPASWVAYDVTASPQPATTAWGDSVAFRAGWKPIAFAGSCWRLIADGSDTGIVLVVGPRVEALPTTTLPPEYRTSAGWSRLPATIATPSDAGPCGEAPRLKVASRVDPPRQTGADEWRFDGCLASPGNVFTSVYLELKFSDGSRLLARLADRVDANEEFRYSVVVARSSGGGAVASIFVLLP